MKHHLEPHEKKTGWNTKLISVAIGLIGWNLLATVETGKAVAELKVELADSMKAAQAADAGLALQETDHEQRIRILERLVKVPVVPPPNQP